ncbi:MAG: cache domain-containing protein [Desulfobulbaceae bacterium]|uniref:histidine kinase n=2 Tax=Desulfofustis glycolicus TaxID=51195 RepID=A0A1M5WLI3_9BACT|nr:cache domain-containing protein [Desulfobulbaceae bacterium]SHH88415.1 PAS domain S-box-containing protein [Desulfofustis glycolicus DSM 9705]
MRSRIFFSFLAALIPALLLLTLSVELVLVPFITNDVKHELTNATGVLNNAVHASASVATRNHLQAIAEKNLEIARQQLSLVEQGLVTRDEVVRRLKEIFLGQQVGLSGYIYCLNSQGILEVHPNRELVGSDISSFAFARQQIDRKQGYIEYDWSNPDEPSARPKALYMVYFEELDWIISASSYRSEFAELLNPGDFTEVILSLRFGESGYAYLFNKEGELLIHPQLSDFNFFMQQEAPVDFVRAMLREGAGSMEYLWKNPGDPDGRRKIVVFESIPEYGWVVASSAYLDEIMAPVRAARLVVYGSILILVVAFALVSFLLSGRLTRPVRNMVRQLDLNTRMGTAEPLPVEGDDEFGRLAGEFNSFLKQIGAQTAVIRREQERYRSLFEASPDAIFLLHGIHFVDCNPATLFIFAASRQDIIGKTVVDVSPTRQPDGSRSEKAVQAISHGASNPETLQIFEWRHRRLDGRHFDAEVRLKAFTGSAEQSLTIAFVRDITERKRAELALRESEEKYRQLIENAHDAIFIAQDGRIVFANHQTAAMIGYSDQELKAQPFTFFIHPEDRELVIQRHSKRLRGDGGLPQNYVFRLLTKAQTETVIQLSAVLIEWNGRPATLNFARDITEQKRLENAFLHAQKMEAIGTLAGGIAHDFNNLLMAIQGRAELLHVEEKREKQLEHARAIEACVKSAGGLTRQLLGFARGGKYRPQPIDLSQLVRSSADLFGRTRKEIRVTIRCSAVPAVAEVDKAQLEQVLLNMYVNAWQAMPRGGELQIATALTDLDEAAGAANGVLPGRYALITVADSGIGIDQTIMPRIFEPFFTTKEKSRGTGLGLASAYGIIRNHGGFIGVDSEVKSGTVFTVYLPWSEKTPVTEERDDVSSIQGSETILLVDDETMILEVGQAMLEQLGYRVLIAQGGQAAVALMEHQSETIDLVILDLIMPGMDGGETLATLRNISQDVPVVLSSGYALNKQMEQVMAQGCSGFLQKPFSLSELSRLVRQILDSDKQKRR